MKMLRSSAFAVMFLSVSLLSATVASAQSDGKTLFQNNCATCHNPLRDATGPALKGVDAKAPSKQWLYDWIHNSGALIEKGDKYAVELKNTWKAAMPPFPNLSTDDIDAIFEYVNSVEEKPAAGAGGAAAGAAQPQEDNTWLYAGITLVLLLLVVILARVNSGLRRVAAERNNQPVPKEIPLYRNKLVIAVVAIVLICLAGYWITNGAINMGRQQNYMPKQPIFFSHKVHAGINQINCLYCHSSAEKGRHAMVPSPNVCMNCHKQVGSYTGAEEHPLVDLEGNKRDGDQEILNLYKYAGWDVDKKDYIRDANGVIQSQPIEWVKIHNLPDHVYFNHAQHVKVGGIQCQQCHGPIQEMDEVYQFSSLSMGWCINCHRQTQVKFTENKYYDIYEKYHQELKEGKRSGVTVEDIGGIECQKCHY